jgi:hypothetical protein
MHTDPAGVGLAARPGLPIRFSSSPTPAGDGATPSAALSPHHLGTFRVRTDGSTRFSQAILILAIMRSSPMVWLTAHRLALLGCARP